MDIPFGGIFHSIDHAAHDRLSGYPGSDCESDSKSEDRVISIMESQNLSIWIVTKKLFN
jgi:hypothetical protein